LRRPRASAYSMLPRCVRPRFPPSPTTLIGASTPEQLKENVGALKNLEFTADELSSIENYAKEGGLNLWEKPSTDQRP